MAGRTVSPARPLTSAELEGIVRRLSRETHAACELDREASECDGVRIYRTYDYDAWLLRWPPGTRVTPHDLRRLGWCVHRDRGRTDGWSSGLVNTIPA